LELNEVGACFVRPHRSFAYYFSKKFVYREYAAMGSFSVILMFTYATKHQWIATFNGQNSMIKSPPRNPGRAFLCSADAREMGQITARLRQPG
jgi:hypothetical protein